MGSRWRMLLNVSWAFSSTHEIIREDFVDEFRTSSGKCRDTNARMGGGGGELAGCGDELESGSWCVQMSKAGTGRD